MVIKVDIIVLCIRKQIFLVLSSNQQDFDKMPTLGLAQSYQAYHYSNQQHHNTSLNNQHQQGHQNSEQHLAYNSIMADYQNQHHHHHQHHNQQVYSEPQLSSHQAVSYDQHLGYYQQQQHHLNYDHNNSSHEQDDHLQLTDIGITSVNCRLSGKMAKQELASPSGNSSPSSLATTTITTNKISVSSQQQQQNLFTTFQVESTKSTKGASKDRRDKINLEIKKLRDLLPIPDSTRERPSQIQLMALVLAYVRKSNYLENGKCCWY